MGGGHAPVHEEITAGYKTAFIAHQQGADIADFIRSARPAS